MEESAVATANAKDGQKADMVPKEVILSVPFALDTIGIIKAGSLMF